MKKNLKILLPTLLVVLTAQFLLVRFFVQKSNTEAAKVLSEVDTGLPHPSTSYGAKEAIQVVLYALRNNDIPKKDSGVTAFWQFSTKRLRLQLRDKALVRPYLSEDLWKAIVDFDSYRITYSKVEEEQAAFEIELVSHKRLARQFVVALHKQDDIWLVDQLVKRL